MRSILLALILTFVAATARAQSTATLEGAVTDQSGAAMPGVSLAIRNNATGTERTVVSDASGKYVAASLPPGIYTVVVWVRQRGARDTIAASNVSIRVDAAAPALTAASSK